MRFNENFLELVRRITKQAQMERNLLGVPIEDLIVQKLGSYEFSMMDFEDMQPVNDLVINEHVFKLYLTPANDAYSQTAMLRALMLIDRSVNAINEIQQLKSEISQLKADQARDDWLKQRFVKTVVKSF